MTRRLVVPTLAGAPPQNQSLGGFWVASCESRASPGPQKEMIMRKSLFLASTLILGLSGAAFAQRAGGGPGMGDAGAGGGSIGGMGATDRRGQNGTTSSRDGTTGTNSQGTGTSMGAMGSESAGALAGRAIGTAEPRWHCSDCRMPAKWRRCFAEAEHRLGKSRLPFASNSPGFGGIDRALAPEARADAWPILCR